MILHDRKPRRKRDTGKSGQSQSMSCQSWMAVSPRKSPCMNADGARGQVRMVSCVWIKLLLKWEGDSVLKKLPHTLGGSVGFCAKACKYKCHARSCSPDYAVPLSSVLQYHQPNPQVMREIYHRFIQKSPLKIPERLQRILDMDTSNSESRGSFIYCF